MLPEQVPGTLFVVLLAVLATVMGEYDVLLILALGCAAAWASFGDYARTLFFTATLGLCSIAVLLLFIRIL